MRSSQPSDAGRNEIASDPIAQPPRRASGSDVRLLVLGGQALWSAAALVVSGLFAIWLVSYLTESVGVEGYGVWATITAVLAPLIVLDAGLGFVVVKATASRSAGRVGAAEEVTTANSLYLVLGIGGFLIGLLLGFLPGPLLGLEAAAATQARNATWVLAADFGLVIATSAFPGVLRGMRRYDLLLVSSLLQAGVSVAVAVALVPEWGIVGAAAAMVAGHAAARLMHAAAVRRFAPWFSMRPHRPRWKFLRRVARFSAPLVVIAVAGQISFSLDVLIVAGFAGAVAASWVSIGARLPWMVVGVLQAAVDVLFPVFVHESNRADAASTSVLWRAIRTAGFMGGCAFTFLILGRSAIIELWIGQTDALASSVLVLYSIAWAIHMPAHVLSLAIVSRGRHAILAPVVLGESLLNLAASVVLVVALGPIGAALASLVAVGVSNGIVIPLVARDRVGAPLRRTVSNAWLGIAAGALVGTGAWLVPTMLGLQGTAGLVIQTGATALLGIAGLTVIWMGGFHSRRPAEIAA